MVTTESFLDFLTDLLESLHDKAFIDNHCREWLQKNLRDLEREHHRTALLDDGKD